MSIFKLSTVFYFVVMTFAMAGSAHWYEITTLGTREPNRFVGSSSLSSEQVAAKVTGTDFIVLENLREIFVERNGGVYRPSKWAEKMYFPSRSILYFSELPGDPAKVGPKADVVH